jgi:dipeptidase D
MRVLDGIKPERVMYYFEEISKIPRCSYEEQKISDYLASVGNRLGLETIQDEALNVIIKKPGTKGYEKSPTVVLQGHMDMVCEKKDGSNHDFSKDPIDLKVDGDLIIAEDTTLGADNGIAVAMGLAIVESENIPHPPLELLITSNEETGMTGASALDPDNIKGKILINIDSEEEGKALVSCAGGERNLVTIPIKWKTLEGLSTYEIQVRGLKGGHSGMEIDKGRGNSNKILGRILERLNKEVDIDISFIEGGSKSNAIPRYSFARIGIAEDRVELTKETIDKIQKELKVELISKDKDIEILLEKTEDKIDKVFADDTKRAVLNLLFLIPNGVQSMSMDIEGLVESSNNLGVVKTLEEEITIECAIRSSIGSLKTDISNKIRAISELSGAEFESSSSYPAWEYKNDSYIREVFKKAYEDINGKPLEIDAIHAGLECGLFDEKFDDMDMISFGPNIYGVHAPGENFSISSTDRSYELLLKVLEYIK